MLKVIRILKFKIREIMRKIYLYPKQLRFKNRDVSIICNNCVGCFIMILSVDLIAPPLI